LITQEKTATGIATAYFCFSVLSLAIATRFDVSQPIFYTKMQK
jgi:hypothetical protein